MKSIAYVVPYFGKLPSLFPLWLLSCRYNPTVDWLIFTDDKTPFDYPPNVKVKYCSFDDIRVRIQKCFDFSVSLERPYKLCDFRVAYGDIFKEELSAYDFWGHCDLDLIWGDIRAFYTDEVLDKYVKIGYQGHSTLYKNEPSINLLYRRFNKDGISYRQIFSSDKNFLFDEDIICNLYDDLKIEYFRATVFAQLNRYSYGFFLQYLPPSEDVKNRRQIFTFQKGVLSRLYLEDGIVKQEEYMYIHFFSRPMKLYLKGLSFDSRYIIVPDKIFEDNDTVIDFKYINKHGKKSALSYFIRCLIQRRKRLSLKKIVSFIRNQLKYGA